MSQLTTTQMFDVDIDQDGIALLSIDMPDRRMNVLNDDLSEPLLNAIDAFCNDDAIKGLIITSKKDSFIAGADLNSLATVTTAEEAYQFAETFKKGLRQLELSSKPVVAALNGTALGGGLELALAANYRIAINNKKSKLGLPEVKLGLLPGGGGTQRLPRLIGIQPAIEMMTQGSSKTPEQAQDLGFVDALADDTDDMIAKAKAYITQNPNVKARWDEKGFKIPGGDSKHPKIVQMLAVAPAMANQKSHGNYPAITHIMSCVFEGCLLSFDVGLQIESRYFAACVMSQTSKNLVNTMWTQLNAIKKGQSRPDNYPQHRVSKVGILGAGMMGAGIAYVAAKAGIDVVLLDTNLENAEKGKGYSEKLLDKAIKRGRSNEEKKQALLSRIQPTTDYQDLSEADLVIEAVFEDREIKAACTRQSEAVISDQAIYASNTSTLPITSLAKASERPDQFIGLHFFSPVDKMQLVEIIMGEQTNDETLAKGFDFVLQIGKTPIVVNDSRGFYTSRVFATYVSEGIAMLGEGVHPQSIETAGIKAGMPMPPLALQDEVSLSLFIHITEQTKKDLAEQGIEAPNHPSEPILKKLVDEYDRVGKKSGKGFYDYTENGKKLWPKLVELFPPRDDQPSQQELIDRLLYIQANETARCYQENVVRSVADANVGSIFGWGFAPNHGGTLQFINAIGPKAFIERSQTLAKQYGDRFEPAKIVKDLADKGAIFKDGES